MPQRLNWTNRKRIERADVGISIVRDSGGASFNAKINLSDYSLPAECRVVVEAYRQTTWRRFDFGTVAFVRPATDCRLDAFGEPDGVQFRVKVLSGARDDGRIWAEADRVPVTSLDEREAGRRSLLPTRGYDLEDAIWRLEFDESRGGPTLLVNNRLGDWRQAVQTVPFRSLVYPELFRRVLTKALADLEDDERDWHKDWISFASRLPGASDAPDSEAHPDAQAEWVEDAVKAFCRQQKFAEKFGAILIDGSVS